MTGNQSKPWHPNRKHYRCSRRENLTLAVVYVLLGTALQNSGEVEVVTLLLCHKFLVLTMKKLLKSVYIYGSYRTIKTKLPLFWTTLYYMELNTAGIPFSPRRVSGVR